jgi:ribosome biogenesis GTPase
MLATGEVSKRIGRGRHTTRHAEFFLLASGGYAIDTPGFSSLEPPDVPNGERAALFKEFRPWLGLCKFRDCLHWSEQDCAVKAQLGISIDQRRYDQYLDWIRS